jgi:ribose-phosphate pyrophosphokinase
MSSRKRLKIFTGNANPELAEEIAQYLGVSVGDAKCTHFSDGEIQVKINESVRGATFSSSSQPAVPLMST